jgi:hypothetical protein
MLDEFTDFCERMAADERVLGVILAGSMAREGAATVHSDYDVCLIAAEGMKSTLAGESRRDSTMDVAVSSLREFRQHALPGSGSEWDRYTYTHAKVLKDTPDGLIRQLVTEKGTMTAEQAADLAVMLDGFLNSLYRSAKDERDGNAIAARLDAAESLGGYLTYIFALHQRIRPFNKYLAWELRNHPLSQSEWSAEHLLPLLAEVVSENGLKAARQLLNELEPHARAAGHSSVFDAWGEDLVLMRGER